MEITDNREDLITTKDRSPNPGILQNMPAPKSPGNSRLSLNVADKTSNWKLSNATTVALELVMLVADLITH